MWRCGVQVEKHKSAAVEAIKTKEETEVKCQQKIADMVALMEKHKVGFALQLLFP